MNGATQVVQVTADDSMHFNGDRFTVKTGQPVRIELTNNGHKPREEMAHNFVILKPSTDVTTFNLLSAQAKANDYVAPDQLDAVIAHTTGLAGPGETVVAEFTAPAPGQYPFLCNFPGHYAAGMHGIMTVAP
jgi:azurin